MRDEGRVHAATLYETAVRPAGRRGFGRLWAFLRGIRELRRLALESRDLWLSYAALARLFNPWTLLVVAAAVAGFGLIGVAAVSVLWVILF